MWTAVLLSSGSGLLAALAAWYPLTSRYRRLGFEQGTQRLWQMVSGKGHSGMTAEISLRSPFGLRSKMHSSWIPLFVSSRISFFLEQAGSKITVGSFLLYSIICLIVASILALWIKMPWLAAPVVVCTIGAVPYFVIGYKRQRRLAQLNEQLPDAVRLIASAMRAGLGFEVGMGLVESELPDPIQGEFRKLLNESRLSSDMNESLRRMAKRIVLADFRLFAACACLHREVGGNFTHVLDRLGHTVRERFQLRRELKTLTSESRLTGWILGIFPLLIALALGLMQPDYFQPLIEEPQGRIMLWGAIALQIIGIGIIRWLTTPRLLS